MTHFTGRVGQLWGGDGVAYDGYGRVWV